MVKTKKLSKIAILCFILLFSVFGIFCANNIGHAATAPTAILTAPANGAVFQAGANGLVGVGFTTSISDPDSGRVLSQVMYRKVGEASWHSYGTTGTTAPSGTSVPNGIGMNGTQRDPYINNWGWNCRMGYGTNPPANCDTIFNNGSRSGPSAWSYTNIYNPKVNFDAGTYEWTAKGYDFGLYGAFATKRTFTVRAYVPPAPPPAPEPEPSPEPTPDFTPDGGGGSTVEDITAPLDDKEPPSVPESLTGEFIPDENSIKLSWGASTDNIELSGYEVERTIKDANAWGKIAEVSSEEYIDFEFEPQKTYQYRVRAYDQTKNFSAYSNIVEVTSGEFFPNVFAKDGGKVESEAVTMEFPAGSVTEDLFVTAEKSPDVKIQLSSGTKKVGDIYELKAKNSRGEEVTKFKTQISVKFKYAKNQTGGTSESTIKLANYADEKVNMLPTSLDLKNREASTLTDHFSTYLLVAQNASPWVTFFKIILWIVLILAIAGAGYYGYVLYKRKKYQEAHREDYIYRS